VLVIVKPARRNARTASLPETTGRMLLMRDANFHRSNDRVGFLHRRRVLEVQLERFPEVGKRLFDAAALAGDLDLQAARFTVAPA
jgi:hypothetical protein